MRLDEIKGWIEVATGAMTTLALVVGGIFGAYQYLEKAREDQVKETLNFFDRYNREPVAHARALQQEKWQGHYEEEKNASGKDYDKFIARIIATEKLEPSIAVLSDFYAALEICSRNQICEPAVALQLFQEDACSFFNRHYVFFEERRRVSGDQSIGRGAELFAKDARGAATVSCIKRQAKWYERFRLW